MATQRPLSPHLQVYRWQITMTLSIIHRATGVGLTVGAFALTWFLVMLALGPEQGAHAMACVGSPVGLFFAFAFSLCLMYHLLNGLRHLLWDIGRGYDIPSVYKTGWTVIVLTVVFTAALWFFAMGRA
ncbi:Succinate dehydrogenase cytochrome b-556 subunit [Lysobacter dokdonensis DS-58]|uniref:Succinate dehydrogenase cytochrome b556 subunit n=1 Tax=Lysobacter dokdonensis DS-58 TaxID=1300345 RepID=A0A0A2WNT2_9GAMM|nr:succinate dehydrogenase, cytochrome b556 subunit [Lysobacter dokdonensis]KGQ20402.1 Succinate dehydrogenase cytochrome b-556 subunit [Lysobacter dokdonensis DS-58]